MHCYNANHKPSSSSSSSPETSAFSCPALAMSCARSCSSLSEMALGLILMTRDPPKSSIALWIDSIAFSNRSTAANWKGTQSVFSQNRRSYSRYLVSSICAQHIQRWGYELRFDWDGVVTLFLSSSEGLFNGVNTGRGVACKLNIRTKLDGLGRQTTSDSSGEDGERRGGNGLREGINNSFRLAARQISVSHRRRHP